MEERQRPSSPLPRKKLSSFNIEGILGLSATTKNCADVSTSSAPPISNPPSSEERNDSYQLLQSSPRPQAATGWHCATGDPGVGAVVASKVHFLIRFLFLIFYLFLFICFLFLFFYIRIFLTEQPCSPLCRATLHTEGIRSGRGQGSTNGGPERREQFLQLSRWWRWKKTFRAKSTSPYRSGSC